MMFHHMTYTFVYCVTRPVAMVLSMPAPHGPEDAAPQYQHLFENVTTHRLVISAGVELWPKL